MLLRYDSGTGYRFSGTTWKEALIWYSSLISIRLELKSRPSVVSTSWVINAHPDLPSGQNQMNGISVTPLAFMPIARHRSRMFSTVVSTGQWGNGRLSHPRRYTF